MMSELLHGQEKTPLYCISMYRQLSLTYFAIGPTEFVTHTHTYAHSYEGKQLRDSPRLHQIDSIARSDNVAVETPRHIQYPSAPLRALPHAQA